MLNKIQKLSYKWFGKFATKHVSEKLKHDLLSAHMNIKADAYFAQTLMYTLLGLIGMIPVSIVLFFVFSMIVSAQMSLIFQILFVLLPLIVAGLIFVVYGQLPASNAKVRGKKIDVNLSYALNFVSAMSSAGVTPTEIFKSLSKQSIYGEVQSEAAWIYRDVAVLGKDILTAIRENMKRTPSERFKEFLQGLIVTVTSGGSLKTYFSAKAQQYMVENRQRQKQTIESLGIMAESYVTAAVAGILLLFIVIPLMMIISGDTSQMIFLYVIVFLVVPMVHLGFGYVIRMMSLEG